MGIRIGLQTAISIPSKIKEITSTNDQSGLVLATASGDHTVKIWDFKKGECTLTFVDHNQVGVHGVVQ